MSLVSVNALTYEYPETRALDKVSFTLEAGSITALVGPNGAGKSTLMRCMAALDTPLNGEITIDGKTTEDYPREVHRVMGYLPDTFGVYSSLSVEQTLQYFAAANGVPVKKQADAVARVMALCELGAYRETKAESLSRGWRQRLGIAQTLVHNPKIILLDEPASGLDPEARHSLSQLFLRLKEDGCCLLVSSHILAELEDYSDRMLILRDGSLLDDANTQTEGTLAIRIQFTGAASEQKAALEKINGVQVVRIEHQTAHITLDTQNSDSATALKHCVEAGLPICGFTAEHESMQQRYMARANAPMGEG